MGGERRRRSARLKAESEAAHHAAHAPQGAHVRLREDKRASGGRKHNMPLAYGMPRVWREALAGLATRHTRQRCELSFYSV